MSTLKTNNIEHLDASTPSIQTTIGGGTILAGVSTVSGALNVGSGTSISSPATNTLTLGTNSVERLRITSGGQIGIGLTDPGAQLHLKGPSEIRFNNAADAGNFARIRCFEESSDNGAHLAFHTGSGEVVRFTNAGNVQIADGNLVIGTSGHGIDFSVTGDGSGTVGTNGEILDEYEEGTWTPSLSNFTLGNGIITGQYTKIGNIVHVSYRIDAGSTTTFTGSANGISGLPFSNALASNTGYLTASNPSNNWFGFTQQYSIGTATNFLQWITSSSNHQVGSATQPFTWGSSTAMRFNMTYRAA